jgi:nitroreductase
MTAATDLVRHVRAAIAAPSIHNSQPWRFRLIDGGIEVLADWDRRLDVVDPTGRELLLSIGAAVFNLRLSIRQNGRLPVLKVLPEPAEPELIARVTLGRPAPSNPSLDALATAIPHRHTNRGPFARVAVPAAVIEALTAAARAEGAILHVANAVSRNAILGLVKAADQRLRAQGVYRAELAEWTRAARGRRDGVPARAFGPWDAMETLPLRDFGLTLPQLRRSSERFEPYPTIAVLSTDGDTTDHWLRAGQALQHVLLVATTYGLCATPMSQPLEIPDLRALVSDPAVGRWAQLILRLGYGQPTTPSARRPVAEVLQGS